MLLSPISHSSGRPRSGLRPGRCDGGRTNAPEIPRSAALPADRHSWPCPPEPWSLPPAGTQPHLPPVMIPPRPQIGIETARAASWTMRTAIGLIAGPESPPVLLAIRGRRVSTSIDSDKKVFTRDSASAPASSRTFSHLRDRGDVGRQLHDQGPLRATASPALTSCVEDDRYRCRRPFLRAGYWGKTHSTRTRRCRARD